MGTTSSISHYAQILNQENPNTDDFSQIQTNELGIRCGAGLNVHPITLNETEFVIATDNFGFVDKDRATIHGLWCFNVIKTKFELVMKYNKKLSDLQVQCQSYNPDTNTIYLLLTDYFHNKSMSKLVIIDLNKKKQTIIPENLPYFGIASSLTFANNTIHLIGGSDNRSHLIFNFKTNKFQHIHTFNEWKTSNSGHAAIYLSKQNKLMVLGGCDHGSETKRMDSIFVYDVSENKWTESDIKLPAKGNAFAFTLTHNEQYLIIMNMYDLDRTKRMEKIAILNVVTMEWRDSKIKIPSDFPDGVMNAIAMELCPKKDILVSGYIQMIEMDEEVGNDIIQYISSLLETEYIYIMTTIRKTDIPFKTSVAAILS